MTSIMLTVTGARAQALVSGPLTSGMVGIPVTIQYDDSWKGLTKNLVCRCSGSGSDGAESRSILNVGSTAVVAQEVMKAGMILYLGIEGCSADGKLVIPTTWAMCGAIQKGANTGEDLSADPTLPVWGQLQAEIEQLKEASVTGGAFHIGPDVPAGESRPLYWLDTGVEQPPADPGEPEPGKTLTGITVAYTGGAVPAGTAVSELTDILVTACYSDGTSELVLVYTLSGTIGEGSNTVTVTYQGQTATFTVTGVAESGGEEEPEIDLSEQNVYASYDVTASGTSARLEIPYADFLALEAAKLYAYSMPTTIYQKKVTIQAAPNANGQSYTNLVKDLLVSTAAAGGDGIVTNGFDHYSDSGFVVFEIDIAALKAAVQEKVADGTFSEATLKLVTVELPVQVIGTRYLLYSYSF